MKNEIISTTLSFSALIFGVLISSASSADSGMTCEEIEPDFYRCVTDNSCSNEFRWNAPDDILVYPSGGVGSTMALIQDRDVGGCIVAAVVPVDGSREASYTTCGGGRHYPGGLDRPG